MLPPQMAEGDEPEPVRDDVRGPNVEGDKA
jgi:hypothetical protein